MTEKTLKNKISVSLICSDACKLNEDLKILSDENIDYLHMDIMDGHFVPNWGFGLDVINAVRKHSDLPLDIHLMIEYPDRIIPKLNLQKNDIVSIHFESVYRLEDTINIIRNYEAKLFLAINPQTPIVILDFMHQHIDGINFMTINPGFSGQTILSSSFDKFKRLNNYIKEHNLNHLELEVDGNMNFTNTKIFKDMGANIFVAGTSSIFPGNKLNVENIKKFKQLLLGEGNYI